MAAIETCLTILGLGANVAGLHSWFTGLKAGAEIQKLQRELEQLRADVQRLSPHILYAPSVQQVRDITRTRQEQLDDARIIRELLEPIQQGIGDVILSTSILAAPKKLKEAVVKNPWDIFIEITPLHRARRPTNPALVPILFSDGANQYIGWQTQGALLMLFDCEYHPEQNLPLSYIEISSITSQWTNSIGMEFMLISAGTFIMGSPDSDAEAFCNEKPAHHVTISQPFYLGKYPVTQAQWFEVMGKRQVSVSSNPNLPVVCVSWYDTQDFMDKLNKQERGENYRLPTEAQWEYACRAGTEAPQYYHTINAIAWYKAISHNQLQPVGQKLPNAWGLYDMLGNVCEWCDDLYERYTAGAVIDPLGRLDKFGPRVLRGGSWNEPAEHARAAYRDFCLPNYRQENLGFRCLSSGYSK